MRKSAINTIIFDMSEVIFTGIKGVERLLSPILQLNEEIIKNALFSTPMLTELFCGKITEEQYLRKIVTDNTRSVDIYRLKQVIRSNFTEIPGTKNIIQKLQLKGYKLGLLSIHAKEWVEYCENTFQYHKLFTTLSYSYTTQLLKPEHKSYIEILDTLNSAPSQSIFIDDSPVNVQTSNELGMNGILFSDAQQLEENLRSLLDNY